MSNFDWGTRENHGNILSFSFEILSLVRGEIAKLVNYDQAQVDGWSNYRVPWATLGSKASPIWSHAF